MLGRSATRLLRCNVVKVAGTRLVGSSMMSLSTRTFSTASSTRDDSTPWYLNPEASPAVTSPLMEVKLPELPENHPETLENIVHFLAKDLGIQDLMIFDMRNRDGLSLDSEGAYDISDFMVLGTGKSSKHLLKASSELQYYIKHNLHKLPLTEGVLKAGKLAKYHRRLHKKGKTAPNYSKETYGVTPNTWVMTDTRADGIIIHMLTEERRRDLNLEYLWSPESKRGQYARSKYDHDSDDIFRGIRYFHSSTQVRSTFDPYIVTFDNYADEFRKLMRCHLVDHKKTPLGKLKQHLTHMYLGGLALDYTLAREYIETVFQSPQFHAKIQSNALNINQHEKFVASLFGTFKLSLTREELMDLIPIVIAGSSALTHESFLTLKKIINTYNIQQEFIFEHSKSLKPLGKLTTKLTDTTIPAERRLKHNTDLLLLTVFANRHNWVHFFQLLDEAVARNDIALITGALPLISVCADGLNATRFENEYLPLIVSTPLPVKLARFRDALYEKTHPI